MTKSSRCRVLGIGTAGRVVLAALCALYLGACGRFGFELLPAPVSDRDADVPTYEASVPDVGSRDGATPPGQCEGPDCTASGCPNDDSKTDPGVCGCGISDQLDSDGDDRPDCIDFCPGVDDRESDGSCACSAAGGDSDGDGSANCIDACPFDALKTAPGTCGCGASERDGDADGTPDCQDACPSDADKARPGSCGCGISDRDTDLDGTPDCQDACVGDQSDADYQGMSCGEGYCEENSTRSTCVSGVETMCTPAAPLGASDTTCNAVDDDCDGAVDEDFPSAPTTCGRGVCASSGTLRCVDGAQVDSCVEGAPSSIPETECNGLDDDCDSSVDEDFPVVSKSCGMGACAATGSIRCIEGNVVDSCMMTSPTGVAETQCNGVDDDCDGSVDEDYVATATTCGTGACARTGQRTCVNGRLVDSCAAGSPTASRDTTCNGVDEDCDGERDEDFAVSATSCGRGVCASTGQLTCVNGATRNSCTAGSPQSSTDDSFTPGNGRDDDCDGQVDEDVPPCNTTPRTFEAGSYTVSVPGNCQNLTVQLWGGGGAAGDSAGFSGKTGPGGPGGYARATARVSGTINLHVGNGGASGCDAGGSNPGSSAYNGGSGGTGGGANGADGVVSGGGAGGSGGSTGGRGYYGGGGGGEGNGGFGASGRAGGGGAASVLLVNGVRAAVAGGGGGGGGAQAISFTGFLAAPGGNGGSGCGGAGTAPENTSGGGGGGGTCVGATTQRGSGTTPASASAIPSGRARGATSDCGAGGNGYAIITFAP